MISMVCNLLIAVVLIAMMVETEAFIMTKRKTMPSSLHIRQHESKEQLVIVPTGGRSYTAKFTSPNKNRLHLAKDDDSANNLGKLKSRKKGSNRENNDEPLVEMLLTKYENEIDELCQATYNIMKATIFPPVRDYINIQKNKVSNENNKDPFAKLIAPPELPGIPRPVWLVILGSIPTGLIWYGYYKFSIEEELYHLELESENGKVTGFGGYGTLFPFVYAILLGFPLCLLPGTPGPFLIQAASIWILVSQVNLYRRVNELCMEKKDEFGIVDPPLYEWWALLPPPMDVVVGLRQIHFLSEYWRVTRGEEYDKDLVAETLFPFIAWKERITLKQFFRTPSKWFWFTKDVKDFDYHFLKE